MTATHPPTGWTFGDVELPVHSMNTLVVGSGAAARKAALELVRQGQRSLAIVTERWNAGASYNAGSDKQTYYKLSLAGQTADSVVALARDLGAGGSMHGDIALCEAQHSAQAFFDLVALGVPFPHDRFGGFVGYRTDNDPRGRATSAGPHTSRLMCERLGNALVREGVPVFDDHHVVALLTGEGERRQSVCGAVALHKTRSDAPGHGLTVFNAVNVVLATGGPGGLYRSSVYPQSQLGGVGFALTAGAIAHNLTESQFGLGTVGFRWNLSGSYQQVIPRYVSRAHDGTDEREFLNDHFPDLRTLTSAIFRKGYEWPFDCARVTAHGSSLIDLLVYRETEERGRRVVLDYTANPSDPAGRETFAVDRLAPEVREYLENSRAVGVTPIERLRAMNPDADAVFRDHGIDLAREPVSVAVCAQHNNGGLRANHWWESNLRHLFPVGEVCGTHGVRRPGGAALNAGQVGALRAARYVAHRHAGPPPPVRAFGRAVSSEVRSCLERCAQMLRRDVPPTDALTPTAVIREIQDRMSRCAAHVRDPAGIVRAADDAWALHERVERGLRVAEPRQLPLGFRAADLCLTHAVYLEALRLYLEAGGRSRGSAIVLDPTGERPCDGLGEHWRFSCNESGAWVDDHILEVEFVAPRDVRGTWVDVRPIPPVDGWFERVWADFRNDGVYGTDEGG